MVYLINVVWRLIILGLLTDHTDPICSNDVAHGNTSGGMKVPFIYKVKKVT